MPFEIHTTPGADVQPGATAGCWRLEIPPGPAGQYRLAQLDNYTKVARRSFPHAPPRTLHLRARVSAANLPGTWGFGWWNDPFSLSLGFGGGVRRLPALPNAAWFFFASPQNYLSFREDKPAQNFLAQTFCSPHLPVSLLSFGALAFPLMLIPPVARIMRSALRRVVREDSFAIGVDMTQWHEYRLDWRETGVTFQVDGQIFKTDISPTPPLGTVIWIDNQFAAFHPSGKLSYGTLAYRQSAWLEVEMVHRGVGDQDRA